jgi:hypothetical protein
VSMSNRPTGRIARFATRAMLFGALIAAAPTMAVAQGGGAKPASEQQAGKVTLELPVVYATSAHSNVDPRLSDIARYLKNLRYTGYELLGTQRAQLSPKGGQTFSIAGNRKVKVQLLSREAKRVRVRVRIIGGKGANLLDTTLWVNRNGTFIVAGPKHKDGILVLPLTARY